MRPGIDYIGVGVGALVVNEKRQILLLRKRSSENHTSNIWTIPGGQILFGEAFDEAIDRELTEETNLRAITKAHIDCINYIDNNTHWISFVFSIKEYDGKPMINEPLVFEAMQWFDIDHLPPLNPISKITIERNLGKA